MKVPENISDNLKKLPGWVVCRICHKEPTEHDWLIELVPHSNALIHQSCAANQGKFAGLNIAKGE